MSDYKRLTKYSKENEDYITPYCDTANCNGVCVDCDYEQVIINRLAYLEDKIDNGTLIELPCKVGDTVYVLREESFAKDNYKIMWHIAEGFVKKIYINKKNEIFLQIISWVNHKSWSKDSRNYKVTTFGQTVFLTKAEAEKKLQELRAEK